MRLMLVKEAAREPLFESEASIRAMIQRGELVKGVHWFQDRRGGRIRLDLDAVVEKFTRTAVEAPIGRIRLVRGGSFAAHKEASELHGLPRG